MSMRWTERQRAMLREMGVHLWSREDRATAAAVIERGDAGVATAPADAARSPRAPEPAAAPAPARAASVPASAAKLAPADWLVVGEPFDGADAQQEQLLDNMLRAIGVARSAPLRERRATFVAVAAAARAAATDEPDEIAAAIASVAPRCIVALGRAAAAAVLGSDAPIGHWRGRRHERGGVPVVVTFAPAFLLRHPEEKAKAWADLCLAVAQVAPLVA
jgi:uracil-DNA glycosylase